MSASIEPVAMEHALAFMDEERQRLDLDASLPGDERGAPTGPQS